jgi:DNA-binding CsgD family transcriptional regulator
VQELWQRLSVFEGGFSVEAAEEVCGGQARGRPELPRAGVIHAIISLVDKSVLTRETSCGPESTATRYRMLDTIRAFGAARLADSGNAHAARVRLLNRYLAMARYCAGHFLDDDQVDQFRRLQAESASIRAVLSCALEDPREDLARRGAEIAVWLLAFWMGTSQQREGTYWFGQVIERFPGRTPERARALIARCYLRAGIGPAEESIADGRAGVRLADELGDEEASARGRLFLGHALTGGQRFDEAARVAGQAREALTALGDRNGLLLLNSHLATLHDFAGDYAEAVAWYERGIAGHGPGERWQTGWLHIAAGDCYARMDGKMAERRAALRAALEAKDEIGDQVGLAYVLEGFALLAFEDGRLARSAWLAGAAVPLWEKTGSVLGDLPHLLALRERVRGETRERLGSTQFELLFARGRGYPLDQVVQLAASDADKLPPLPPRSGETGITSREHEIATLAAQGLSRGETADRLGISKRTVDAHLEHIHAKLGLSTQEQLTAWIADQPPQT